MMIAMGMPWWSDASREEIERALKMINRTRLQFWLPKNARLLLKQEANLYSNLLKRMDAIPPREPVVERQYAPVTQAQIDQVIAVLPLDHSQYLLEPEIALRAGVSLEVAQSVLHKEGGNLCSYTLQGGMTYVDGKPVWGPPAWQGIENPHMRRQVNFADHDGPPTAREIWGGL
jgi:hypothetical protein